MSREDQPLLRYFLPSGMAISSVLTQCLKGLQDGLYVSISESKTL